jgi:hypothetical protein
MLFVVLVFLVVWELCLVCVSNPSLIFFSLSTWSVLPILFLILDLLCFLYSCIAGYGVSVVVKSPRDFLVRAFLAIFSIYSSKSSSGPSNIKYASWFCPSLVGVSNVDLKSTSVVGFCACRSFLSPLNRLYKFLTPSLIFVSADGLCSTIG